MPACIVYLLADWLTEWTNEVETAQDVVVSKKLPSRSTLFAVVRWSISDAAGIVWDVRKGRAQRGAYTVRNQLAYTWRADRLTAMKPAVSVIRIRLPTTTTSIIENWRNADADAMMRRWLTSMVQGEGAGTGILKGYGRSRLRIQQCDQRYEDQSRVDLAASCCCA